LLGIGWILSGQLLGTPEQRLYDIPGGLAIDTLLIIAEESDTAILFSEKTVKDVRTQAVRSFLTLDRALGVMLENTPLEAVPVSNGRAYAILPRAEKGGNVPERSENQLQKTPNKELENQSEMNLPKENKKTIGGLFKGLLTLAVAGSSNISAQEGENDEGQVYELSPFSVDSSEDTGYRATTTLAGTRLNTNLRDIGSAISVMTDEFLEDVGATDAATALSYGLNIEVNGPQGNYAGDTGQQSNPQRNGQRVRGLAAASLTRGFFLTDIPFDSYNTSRVTINRGPNSLLFGIGSVGGVIDGGVIGASLGKNFGEFKVRFGERSSYRTSFDVNRVLIEDRLAIRIAGLNEDNQYQQRPAFETDKRIHGAIEATLFKNENSGFLDRTILRGNFESGSIDGTPPSVTPPFDGISPWFAPPSRSGEAIAGVTLPSWVDDGSFIPKATFDTRPGVNANNVPVAAWYMHAVQFPVVNNSPTTSVASVGFPDASVAGTIGRITWNQANHGRNRFDTLRTDTFESLGRLPGFRAPVIMDSNVLDNENLLISGTTGRVEKDFDVRNFVFEQGFLNGKAGIELAYDVQTYQNDSTLPYGDNTIYVDIAEYLSNDQPNPNLGKPFYKNTGMPIGEERTERDAFRTTAFYELNFKENEGWSRWLGRHVFTGFYSDQSIDTLNKNFENNWIDASNETDVATILNHGLNGGRRLVVGLQYLTDESLLGSSVQSFSDVNLNQYVTARLPQDGDSYFISYNHLGGGGPRVNPNPRVPGDPSFYDEFVVHKTLSGGQRNKRYIESKALSWQSFLFDGNLVGLVGWRNDATELFERVGNELLPDGEFDIANLQVSPDPSSEAEGDTLTKSLVAHFPEKFLFELPGNTDLSAHYNESENFSPSGVRRNIYGDILPTPTASTKEYGFTLELFDNDLSVNVNWFEMSSSFNGAGVGLGGLLQQNDAQQRWKTLELDGIPFEDVLAQSIDDSPNADFSKVVSYDYINSAFRMRLPTEIEALTNTRFESPTSDQLLWDPILGLTATRSFVAKDVEVDIVGNLSDNWRVSLNIGQQETVQSDTAKAATEVAQQVQENLMASGLWDLQNFPDVDQLDTIGAAFTRSTLTPLAAARAKDGTVTPEQREWRINLATNYRFSDQTLLKGFALGGAVSYQSEVAIGYPLVFNESGLQIPVVDSPYLGPKEINGDLWLSYNRALKNQMHWKIQLNVRNAFGDDSQIPVLANPDGAIAVIRNPKPKEIFLTNTISF